MYSKCSRFDIQKFSFSLSYFWLCLLITLWNWAHCINPLCLFTLCKMGDNGYLSCKVIEGLKERMQEKNMVHHKCNNWLIHLLMTNVHTHIGLGTRYRDHAMDPPDLLPICNTRAYLKKWNTRMRAFTNDIYKNIFIVTLFVMVTNWKLPNVHQQWMDK